MKKFSFLFSFLVGLLFICMTFGLAPTSSAMPQMSTPTKLSILHVVNVANVGEKTIWVCRDWTGPNTNKIRYACIGDKGTLREGQNARKKFRWVDTDGVRVPRDYKLMRKDALGFWYTVVNRKGKSTIWMKLSGPSFLWSGKVKLVSTKAFSPGGGGSSW